MPKIVNQTGNHNRNPIIFASLKPPAPLEVFEVLIKYGANVNHLTVKNNTCMTLYLKAEESDIDPRVIWLFLEKGYDPRLLPYVYFLDKIKKDLRTFYTQKYVRDLLQLTKC